MVQDAISGGNLATGKNVHSCAPHCLKDKCVNSTLLASISLMVLSFPSNALAQDAAGLYKEKCSGCHTIGGGDLVGPDLARSATWPDSELDESIKRMETNTGPLTDAEVKLLKGYLKAAKPKSVSSNEPPATVAVPASAVPPPGSAVASTSNEPAEQGSPERGKRLFQGSEAFKNGGLSCVSCHSVDGSGGNMAPDLTAISSKMSAAALVNACEHTPYKVMKIAYKDHAILHQEALDLEAYFSSLKEPHEKAGSLPVALWGSGVVAAILASIAIGYRGRKKTAREKLQRRD